VKVYNYKQLNAYIRKQKMQYVNHKIVFVFALVLLVFSYLIAGLYQLQVVKHTQYNRQALREYRYMSQVAMRRGRIFDRHGNCYALSIQQPSLYIDPLYLQNHLPKTAITWLEARIEALIPSLAQGVRAKLQADNHFQYILRLTTPEKAERLLGINDRFKQAFPDLRLERAVIHLADYEYRRMYPYASECSYVIGFCSPFNEGLEGIEYLYDDWLKQPNHQFALPLAGKRGMYSKTSLYYNSRRPLDMHLTICHTLQAFSDDVLARLAAAHNPRFAVILIQSVRTGEIHALSVFPGFDCNKPSKRIFAANPVISHAYEPGSTFKVVTFAYLLEHKQLDLTQRIDCEQGAYYTKHFRVRDVHPYSELKAADVLVKSSNIGTIKLAGSIGAQEWYRFLQHCGFGSKTTVGLPGENTGNIDNVCWDMQSKRLSHIGQGISVSLLQLTSFFQAVGNGGVRISPRIVHSLSGDTPGASVPAPASRRLFSRATADTLCALLQQVVATGTGRAANVEHTAVGGKTGTAQIFNPATGHYESNRHVASFIGLVPIHEPEWVIAVMAYAPKGTYYGGSVAAPFFGRLVERMLQHETRQRLALGRQRSAERAAYH